MKSLLHILNEQGFAILPDVLPEELTAKLVGELESIPVRHGMRDVANVLWPIRQLAKSSRILDIVATLCETDAHLVRSLFFDKTPQTNWPVAWHQDRTIAVREKRELDGFTAWTLKDGIPHVQPPSFLMEDMVTLRIHLDDADEANGALRVIPRTHRLGYLTAPQIQQLVGERDAVTCVVPRGGVLAMKPLLVHSSRRAKSPRHRRVIHFEYAAQTLPGGLHWAEA